MATDPIRHSRRIGGMNTRALLATSTAVVIVAVLPAAGAAGDGLPGEGVAANPLSAPGGDVEYVATSARHHTVLRERALGGRTLRQLRLRGTFTVPAVAYDGSPSGLSADGRTLVLIKPRTSWPRKRTTFAVIDAAACRCAAVHPSRRLQLRRDLAERPHRIPDPVPLAARRDQVRRAGLRHARAAASPRPWWTRASPTRT